MNMGVTYTLENYLYTNVLSIFVARSLCPVYPGKYCTTKLQLEYGEFIEVVCGIYRSGLENL